MMLTGKAKVAGVMGWPISHSRSPMLHGYWLKEYGIDGAYLPFSVDPANLEAALRALPALGIAGTNLTVPHKETALAICDDIDDTADAGTAVLGGYGPLDDLDPLNIKNRELADIHRRAGGCGHRQAVDQNQDPVGLDALHPDLVAGFSMYFAQLHPRHRRQGFPDVAGMGPAQLLRSDHFGPHRRFEQAFLRPGSGHDQLIQIAHPAGILRPSRSRSDAPPRRAELAPSSRRGGAAIERGAAAGAAARASTEASLPSRSRSKTPLSAR